MRNNNFYFVSNKMQEKSKIKVAYNAIVCWFIISNLPDSTSGK